MISNNYIGRTCPYCQFPLKTDSEVAVCPSCKVPHHLECWQENGGCTTFGCGETTCQAETEERLDVSFDESSVKGPLSIRSVGMSKLLVAALVTTLGILIVVFLAYINQIVSLEEALESFGKPIETSRITEVVFEYNGLVEVRDIDETIEVELIYATMDNFTGEVLYSLQVCLLRRSTAEKLAAANAEFAEKGYRIKIWDAYRPRSVQGIMFVLYPDPAYVADPAVGSNHNRGTSVDVTLVDEYGNELLMPTGFDDFTEKASRSYSGISEEARRNVEYLTAVMVRHGFEPIRSEWWHFNDSNMKDYDFLDVSFEEWVNAYFANKQLSAGRHR